MMKRYIAWSLEALLITALMGADSLGEEKQKESTAKKEVLELAVGFSDYEPKLDDVRDKLQQSGGGKLVADKKRTFHVAVRIREGDVGKSIQYYTYKAESTSKDFKIEIHNLAASWTGYLGEADSRLVPYLAVGTNLLYMHREGHVELRGFKRDKYNDWLWGIHGAVGIDIMLVRFIRVGYRLIYLWSKASTLGGTEYSLGGWTQAFTASLYFR